MQKIDFRNRLNAIKSTPKVSGSERSQVIGLFLTKLNSERGKYPPLKASRVAVMLSPIKSVKDLRAFYSECLYHDSPVCGFSKWFFYCFKKK